MPINYQYQPDDPAGSLFGVPDEQSDSWWAGVKQCFVAVAITAAAATSASATQVAISTASQHQDEVGFLHGQPDEDFWQNYVQPVPASIYQALPFTDHDEIPSGLYGQPDEDLWVNPTAPVQATNIWPQQWTFDDVFAPATISTEEDFWINPVAPVPATLGRLWLPDPEEIPAGQLHGQPDEDLWINPVAPIVASIYQQLPYSFDAGEDVPAIVFSTPDEDFWINPVFPQSGVLRPFTPWDQEELPGNLHGQADEDYWQNPVAPVVASIYQPLPINWVQDDFGYSTISFDEDFWTNPVLPTVASLRGLAPWDSEEVVVPQIPLPVDELYWQNPVAPIAASIWQNLPIAVEWDDIWLPPVKVDWLLLSSPSSTPRYSGGSAIPSLVLYQAYVVENEVYMSSLLLPLQILQPFNLFPGNGVPIQAVLLLGSTWNTTQTPVVDATGTLTVYDPLGNEVYSVPFTNEGAGFYQALIDGPSFNPTPGSNYTTVIALTSPTVQQPGKWTIPTNVRPRTTP